VQPTSAIEAMANETEPVPILTPGIEPTTGESHSPPSSPPTKGVWSTKSGSTPTKEEKDVFLDNGTKKTEELSHVNSRSSEGRKRIVVVGLGMVGIAFM
jgi:nitrite reductase (NAD(P)H)